MSGGYTLNQIRDEISKCCVVVEGFPQGTDKQSFAHIFHHKRAKQVEDGLKWLILLQDQESAKEWVNRGKHKVFNFTLDIVAGTGTDIPDDWLQDDNAKNPEKSEPFDSKQDHTSSSGEPESMTSKIPLASGPQIATFEQKSSKSGVPPMYYPNYPSMPMADAMEPPSYDSHNFQYGSQSMQTPQSAQIHVLYSKEEKPSFDKCPVKTPAEDTLSNQKNIQEEKQTSDAYDSIKVCNLPGSITDDSLSDYFENVKRSGGGPVSKVIYDVEKKTAIVTFEDPNVVKNVLKKQASSPLLMNKQQIEIEMYIPKKDMENESQKIMAISVRNLPQGTNDEQIELFFENQKKSGGGEV